MGPKSLSDQFFTSFPSLRISYDFARAKPENASLLLDLPLSFVVSGYSYP